MKKVFLNIMGLLLLTHLTHGQQISIDGGIKVGNLWCFPLVSDSLTYMYLPLKAQLSIDHERHPQFSLVRYVITSAEEAQSTSNIRQAKGGAVLHFLVEYDTPRDSISQSEAKLKKILNVENVKLKGPIVFEDGRYALVSSILNSSKREKKVLASGPAPVLEGNRVALSFELAPEESAILLESFKMATPDLSLVFDMSFGGLTDAYNAELTVDWEKVKKHQSYNAGVSLYYVSADVSAQIDELRSTNAITLKTTGEDSKMDALLTTVYDRITDLLFLPVEAESIPQQQQGGINEAISSLFNSQNSRGLTGFGVNVGYKVKDIKSAGTTKLNFHSRMPVKRHHYITFNIGNLYHDYGNNPAFFRTVVLDDPDFQQREVFVGLDGAIVKEFNQMINSVTVSLKKSHQNNQETIDEITLTRGALTDSTQMLKMVYGSKADTNRLAWLDYEFRTIWKFQNGGSYTTDWIKESSSMINLFTPYERRRVEIVGNRETLSEKGVRAVIVQLDYSFFAERRKPQLVLKPSESMDGKFFDITLPLNQYEYAYTIVWIKNGGEQISTSGKDSNGIIFIDDLPEH